MIQLCEISKTYDRTILKNISLTFDEGKIYLIKGVSGSGKTTLLNIIGLVDLDYDGELFYYNEKASKEETATLEELRTHIGYVYQNSLLIASLSIIDNLKMFDNNENEIIKWAHRFHVNHLLHKYPQQLSGGERQRISIIRSILMEKEILICDEPTACLDKEASASIVEVFQSLKEEGKLIIISTHEDCFDEIQDQLIFLQYGECECNAQLKQGNVTKKRITPKKISLRQDIKYSVKQCRKNNKVSRLALIVVFLILFIGLSFRLHFESYYRDKIRGEYPIYTYSATKEFNQKYGLDKYVNKYEDYHFEDKNILYLGLQPYEDSILRVSNTFLEGQFPQNENEVIINQSYYRQNFKGMKLKDTLTKEIYIEKLDSKFKVAGILSDEFEDINKNIYYMNVYSKQKQTIFVMDTQLQSQIRPTDHMMNMYVFKDAKKNQDVYQKAWSSDVFLEWEILINERMYTINLVTNIIFIILGVLSIILFVFLYNTISLDLFYRRNEVGYLRLFGISKKRIRRILSFSYLYKTGIPFVISIIIYYVLMTILSLNGIRIMLHFDEIISLCIIIVLYVIGVAYFPIRKMLKVSIKQLIA